MCSVHIRHVHAFVSSRLDYCNSQWRPADETPEFRIRTQQRVSWPEQGSSTTLLQCFVNSTGFRYGSELPSRGRWSPTNAFMVWRRPTWLTCVSPFRPSSAGGSCGRYRQRDTRRAAYKDYDRSARLRCVWPGDMEQPPRRTEDFNSVDGDICKKIKVISSAASASEDSV